MQVAWTNVDDVDRILTLEFVNDQSSIVDSGGTDLLQPGATFSTTLTMPGQYIVYCSKDHTSFGSMNVTP
jgi:plastocyanin